ncbi:MAG: hypothetical protein FJ045_04260, partial [Crenarchaeota archaeon]|nr:hypothetical protein [Thermoproteota archaeon]
MSMPIETVVNLFSGLVFTVIGLSAAFAIFFLLVVSISDVRTLIWLKLTRGHPNLYIDGKRVRIVGSDRKLKPAAIIKSEPDGEGFVEQPDSEIFFRGFGPGYAFNSLYTATMNISAPQSKDEKNPHGVISRI